MKRLFLALWLLLLASPALAANDEPLVLVSGQIRQIPSADFLLIPTLAGVGVRCVQTDASGVISATASACGSGGGGTGTVTSIATSGLVTGGTITTAGTISLSNISSGDVVGNSTAGSAAPADTTLTAIIDRAIGSTQGQILYRNATVWTALSPGTAGQVLQTGGAAANPSWVTSSLTLITETVTSGSAANVSFASIPNSYRDLEVRVRGRGTKSATFAEIRMRFNSDAGSNYDFFEMLVNGNAATLGGGNSFANTYIRLGYISAATAPANSADFIRVDIGDYRGTTFQKAVISQGTLKASTSAGGIYVTTENNWWRSTAAITQIDVFPDSNGFVDGTVVSLYGRM